jgi:hypothetical protein
MGSAGRLMDEDCSASGSIAVRVSIAGPTRYCIPPGDCGVLLSLTDATGKPVGVSSCGSTRCSTCMASGCPTIYCPGKPFDAAGYDLMVGGAGVQEAVCGGNVSCEVVRCIAVGTYAVTACLNVPPAGFTCEERGQTVCRSTTIEWPAGPAAEIVFD